MEEGLIIHLTAAGVLTGILVCVFLVGISAGEDCGCDFDTSPPDFSWESPGYSSPGTQDNSNSGSTPGSAGGASSNSGSSSSGDNSISGPGSSGDSSTAGSGSISGSAGSSDSALVLAARGADYYRQGDLNQSLDMMNKSLIIDPYSVRAWMTKGEVLSAMGRYIEAAAAYSRVLSLDPSDGPAAAKRGDAYLNAGKYPEAIASYDRAVAMNPGIPGIQSNRSKAKQLASGIIRANLSVAGPDETAGLDPGKGMPVEILPVTTLSTTTPPVSPVPGTTKAAVSLPVLVLATIIAGVLSLIHRRH